MKKILLTAVGVVAVFSGSLCTFAQTINLDNDPSRVTVSYLREDHPSATVRYINGNVASASVGFIKTELPSATVHFNEEKSFSRRQHKKTDDTVVSASAVAVDEVESGSAVSAE
jgi:hypothetical protein